MAIGQISVTLLGTAVIVALGVLFSNSRVSHIGSRLSDTNGRIDSMHRAESGRLQAGMERIEGAIDARLRHVEEKLGIR